MSTDQPEGVLHPIVFGDDDPEDAWDADDHVLVKLAVLRRWVASLEDAIASGDYDAPREGFRKGEARSTIGALLRMRSTPPDVAEELSRLDERLDDVEP